VMVDIDGMAALNHDLGWQHGDAAIAAVRSVLRTTTPGGDVWHAWRGGKFVATLWGSVDTATWLVSLPQRVLQRTKIPVTVCGVAMRSPTPANLPMLAEHMAEGKRTGRGRAYLFDARSN
jgi:GGDEF domain-containing protein